MGDKYHRFEDLAAENKLDTDYRIIKNIQPHSNIAIIAPHGGSIERRTSQIARAIAGDRYSLYLFEGIDPDGTFDTLHITSHRFNEPQCLALLKNHDVVVAVHGCAGKDEEIFIGGLDRALRYQLFESLSQEFTVHNNEHKFQGTHEQNICNRGAKNVGVQIEFSDGLRGAPSEARAIEIINTTLRTHACDRAINEN